MFSGMIKISLVFLMSTLFSLMFGMDSKMVIASSQVAYAMNGEITTNSIEELDSLGELKTADYKRTDITIAKKKKKKKKKRSAGRKRILTGEKSVKSRRGSAKTNLDFDEVDISGQRKSPIGSMVGSIKDKKGFDFVKIRRQWHSEMEQSASNLD